MNILKRLSGMFFTVAVVAMFGCGGGGGGAAQPTTATLKLISEGAAGTKISGVEVTVVLPAGVTVKATPSAANPALLVTNTGVVVLSGATAANPAAFIDLKMEPIYTPATNTTPGKVKIMIPAKVDFDLGEYVTVNADIAAGTFPTVTDFPALEGFIAVDSVNFAPIAGVTSKIVPDIK
jgi:hypothetical protein